MRGHSGTHEDIDPAIEPVIQFHHRHRRTPIGFVSFIRRRWILLLAGSLATFVVFTSIYVLNYQPVILSTAWSWGGSPSACVEKLELRAPRTGERFDWISIQCPPGTTVRWAEPIMNDGPVPITVTTIVQHDGFPFGDVQLRLGRGVVTDEWRGPDPDDWESLVPFRAFTLAPGQFQAIIYQATIANGCSAELTTLTGFQMGYTIFGIERADMVPHAVAPTIDCA